MAKNDRVRAVFMAKGKILENKPFTEYFDLQRFVGGKFDFCCAGPDFEVLT